MSTFAPVNGRLILPFSSSSLPAYVAAVSADSPLAYWRLGDNSPSGAGSVSDRQGAYNATPNGGITWRQAGSVGDGSGYSALFNGSTGYISAGASLATTLLGSASWTVELWLYVGTSSSGTFAAGAASATNRFRAEHSGNRFYFSAEVGGVTVSSSLSYNTIGVWYHVVLTSAGQMYVNGTLAIGTTAAGGRNSTNNLTIGALNTGAANFFNGRIAEVAVYSGVLSGTRVLAHFNAASDITVSPSQTFGVSCNSITPELFIPGSDDTGSLDVGATLVSDGGVNVLEVGGATFRSMTYDNATLFNKWVSKNEGTVQLEFKFSGTLATWMLCQITDKVRNRSGSLPLPGEENNDAYKLSVNATGGSATLNYGGGLAGPTISITTTLVAGNWYSAELKWRAATAPYFSATINGVTGTNSTANRVGNMACQTLHHFLIGNDTGVTPTSLRIRNVKAFNYWVP